MVQDAETAEDQGCFVAFIIQPNQEASTVLSALSDETILNKQTNANNLPKQSRERPQLRDFGLALRFFFVSQNMEVKSGMTSR